MTDNNVLVVGSVALDDVQTPFGEREKSLGGSAVYFSWACSFFAPVSVVGVVGEDFPDAHISMLNTRGIDTQSLIKTRGKTFHWQGRYDFDFNVAHTLKTELNVFADFKPRLNDELRQMKYLFLANIDPEIQLDVARQMKDPKIIAMDTMNYWIENKKDELMEAVKISDYLFVNDAEARQLAGEPNLISACARILSMGPEVVIVKQGEYGVSMFYKAGEREKIQTFSAPSIPLETVVDPTGAGDSFAGAFMGYIASHKKITERIMRCAAATGSVVASFTVEGFSLEALKKADMDAVMGRHRRLREIAYFEDLMIEAKPQSS
jgi:sugar/nucleoside kinase (ribokinase family)